MLRDYQESDAKFLALRRTAALFNEQRTGKTPTVLRALDLLNARKVLIVCPASTLYQWAEEYTRWRGASCAVCIGTATVRQKIIESWTDGLAISYDMLKIKRRKDTVHGELWNVLDQHPEAVILDEAHRIRNGKGGEKRQTQVAKGAFALSEIPIRFALTGTPTPSRADDIWPILHFLYPKQFRSYWKFLDKYFIVEQKLNRRNGVNYMDIAGPTVWGARMLQAIANSMARNRKRKEVMTWLPDKDRIFVHLPITKEQRKYLDELAKLWETEHIATVGVLDRLIRYRQICLDPGLLELKGGSPKTEWLLQFLSDYPEYSVLVFSKFTSYLNRIAPLIPESALITGAVPAKVRREVCASFQAGTTRVLLIQTDAGKEGLTLDKADAVVFMDRYPPIGDLEQAEDRFVATTPDKADKPHRIYCLSIKDSYEIEIEAMLESRKTETDIINNFKALMERRSNHGDCTNLRQGQQTEV